MEQEQEQEPEAVMEQEPECMAVPMVSEEGVAVSEEGPKVQEERMEASVAVGRPRRSCFAGSMDEDSLAQRTAERSERAGMTAYSKGTVPEGAQKGGRGTCGAESDAKRPQEAQTVGGRRPTRARTEAQPVGSSVGGV